MIKNNLLQIRLKLGYKYQVDFARFLEVNEKNYSKLENNKKEVGLDNAFKIANKLNLRIEDIWQYYTE